MDVRRSLATVSLVVGALAGCAARPEVLDPSEETPAEDQPLDIAIDALDIVHGALRLSATMVDGAADLSVRLGGDCEHREVGGGLSTRSTLVWSLSDHDVAEAIACGLVVRARVRDPTRYVNKVAELEVAVDMAADADNAEDGPQLQGLTMSESGIGVAFAPVTRSARLITGDSILQAVQPESEDDELAASDARQFIVPRIDFARSVLRRRPLNLDGSSFVPSLSVGGTSIESEPSGSNPSPQEPAENAPEEG
jgi:hypothetical protein